MTDLERLLSLIERLGSNIQVAKALGISLSALSAYLPNKTTGVASRTIGGRMRERIAEAEKLLAKQEANTEDIVETIKTIIGDCISYIPLPTMPVFTMPKQGKLPKDLFIKNYRKYPVNDKMIVELLASIPRINCEEGDLLFITIKEFYHNGDIILARIEEEIILGEIKHGNHNEYTFALYNLADPNQESIKLTPELDWKCIAVVEYIMKQPVRKNKE